MRSLFRFIIRFEKLILDHIDPRLSQKVGDLANLNSYVLSIASCLGSINLTLLAAVVAFSRAC